MNISVKKECRICDNKCGENMVNLNMDNDEINEIVEIMTNLSNSKIIVADTLPHHLCTNCVNKLHECNNFLQLLNDSNKRMEKILHNKIESKKEPEVPKQIDKSSDSNDSLINTRKKKTRNRKTQKKEHGGQKRQKTFICEYCARGFASRHNLNAHIKVHKGIRKHKCAECSKTYITATSLRIHMLNHTGEKRSLCPHCGKAFQTDGKLNSHIRDTHLEVKRYKCDYCNARFRRPDKRQRHHLAHTEGKTLQCAHCDFACRRNREMSIHTKRVHFDIS